MDADDPDVAERVFAAALELSGRQRELYLADACADNEALRARVDELLRAASESEQYFASFRGRLGLDRWRPEQSPADDAHAAAPLDGVAPGVAIGRFRLLHPVGAGGMGSVWCAERSDGRYESRVAIKFLASMGRPAAELRFAQEARFLAKLDHPNIARLIDADLAPDGRPYLVLEYVQGEPIDRYCDGARLTIEQRIALFIQVVDAIAHAHRHLIVHRDIKPSNVAVDAGGVVKVLDFGISKLLSQDEAPESSDLTQQLGAALTPQYAAPEQIDGDEVTTATDVFSLGMLLWRLLTDVTPRSAVQIRSVGELRAVAARDPVGLPECVTQSTSPERLEELAVRRGLDGAAFVRALRGDLDAILRKATAVDPGERYASASDFAADLRRHLAHEPVVARAPALTYRMRKFVRRHRGAVLAAALTAVAVVTALAIALWQGEEARVQRAFADEQHARAQLTQEFMSFLLSDVASAGGAISLDDLLSRAETMLDRQAADGGAPHGPAVYELANVYFAMGRTDRLVSLLERAERIARERRDGDLLAAAGCTLGRTWLRTEPQRARAKLAEALGDYARLPVATAEAFVSCERASALLAEADGDTDRAVATLRAALQAVDGRYPGLRPKLFLLNELSRLHFDRREVAASLAVNEQIVEAMRRAGLDRSAGYAINLMNRTALLQTAGEVLAAATVQREVYDDLRHLPVAVGFERPVAASAIRLARFEEALRVLAEGEARTLAAGDAFAVAEHRMLEGRALMFLGRHADAAARFDAAEKVLERAPQRNERVLDALALARSRLVFLRGDLPQARDRIRAVLVKLGYPANARGALASQALVFAAQIELAAADAAAAAEYAEAALELARAAARDPKRSADVGLALLLRAKARRELRDSSGARADLEAAIPPLAAGFGPEHPDSVEARALLAEL